MPAKEHQVDFVGRLLERYVPYAKNFNWINFTSKAEGIGILI